MAYEGPTYVEYPKIERDTGPGAIWSEFRLDILGRDVRITFPVTKLAHDGGTAMLHQWAIALRIAADEIDVQSQHREGVAEHTRLFYATSALRRLAAKVNRVMPGRRY